MLMYREMSIPQTDPDHIRRVYECLATFVRNVSQPHMAGLHTLHDMFTAEVYGCCGKDKLGMYLRRVHSLQKRTETLSLQLGGKRVVEFTKDNSILDELTPSNTKKCASEEQIQRGMHFVTGVVMEICFTALELSTTLRDVPDVIQEASWDKWDLAEWYESASMIAEIARCLQEAECLTFDASGRGVAMSEVVQTLEMPLSKLADTYPLTELVSTLCRAEAAATVIATGVPKTLGDRWDRTALALVHQLSWLLEKATLNRRTKDEMGMWKRNRATLENEEGYGSSMPR